MKMPPPIGPSVIWFRRWPCGIWANGAASLTRAVLSLKAFHRFKSDTDRTVHRSHHLVNMFELKGGGSIQEITQWCRPVDAPRNFITHLTRSDVLGLIFGVGRKRLERRRISKLPATKYFAHSCCKWWMRDVLKRTISHVHSVKYDIELCL